MNRFTIKNSMILFFLLIIAPGKTILSQVSEQWVARYTTNTGVIGADYDRANSVAIDEAGYVYVTGASYETVANGTDITTIKYAPNGTQEWLRSYNGPANNFDSGTVLKIDAQGNIYVGGVTSNDFVTLKYNSTGDLLWSAIVDDPGPGAVRALEVDDAGNVIITGQRDSAGTSFDIITIKYNSSGVLQWSAKYNGTGNYDDYPNAMVMDDAGNIYIAGEVRESTGQQKDFITIKYNSEGGQQWAKEYGTSFVDDMATGIDVDPSGNVYITGRGFTFEGDFVTIKYDPSGSQLWLQKYNGPANYDGLTYLKVDKGGNVYVSGRSTGGQNAPDYTTIKYTTDGDQVWLKRYDGTSYDLDEVNAMAIDKDANIYLTGASRGAIGRDYATVKYDSAGVEQWVMRYDAGVTHDEAYSIAVNTRGDVAVCGYSVGNGTGQDYVTIKYVQGITGINDDKGLPNGFSLSQNYPNPFNPATTISYQLPSDGFVTLKLYDVLGNEVQTLISQQMNAGVYSINFNAANLASGIYLYKISSGSFTQTKKMILLR